MLSPGMLYLDTVKSGLYITSKTQQDSEKSLGSNLPRSVAVVKKDKNMCSAAEEKAKHRVR